MRKRSNWMATIWRPMAAAMMAAQASLVMVAGAPCTSFAALREPPPLTRDQVRAGLAGRREQMRTRQERYYQRREGGARYRVNPSGRPEFRVPRDPLPVPPPEALR
ncbi:MAG: hypothetical protein KatS3mg077_3328 [Candidatus Binatia bacterium]|nr:MAG: hypothetical protein KatS3mg077_3328 [Candidatus Binatia bacterium]